MNLASIGVGELVSSQTVMRSITSVVLENGWRIYTASVDAPEGFDVTVSPSSFRFKRGMTVDFKITIKNDGSADIGARSFGSLTWEEKNCHYSVYSSIAVRVFEIDAPAEVNADGTDGSLSFGVAFDYGGAYFATPTGLSMAD